MTIKEREREREAENNLLI